MSTMRGAALPVVKCVTQNVRVPADAEWVIEGYLDEEKSGEGPFGEYLGTYGGTTAQFGGVPVMHVTAVTRRRDAVFETVTISGKTMEYTDTAALMTAVQEVAVWQKLQGLVKEPIAVYSPPRSGQMEMRICLKLHDDKEARAAIDAAFGVPFLKSIYVVEEDVDIFDDGMMTWAMGARFQPHRDLVIRTDAKLPYSEPSMFGDKKASQIGFDLTRPFGPRRPLDIHPGPPWYPGGRFPSIGDALKDGPKHFQELMAAIGSSDGRDVMSVLDELRQQGRLSQERDSGRYMLKS